MQSDESIEALRQLKVSSESRLDAQYELSKRVNESYYNYVMATPEITKKALALASEETRKIYLDYLEKLARLNEQVMQRIIEASDDALKKCMAEVKDISQTNTPSKRRVKKVAANK
jgi:hypothetical protein